MDDFRSQTDEERKLWVILDGEVMSQLIGYFD